MQSTIFFFFRPSSEGLSRQALPSIQEECLYLKERVTV